MIAGDVGRGADDPGEKRNPLGEEGRGPDGGRRRAPDKVDSAAPEARSRSRQQGWSAASTRAKHPHCDTCSSSDDPRPPRFRVSVVPLYPIRDPAPKLMDYGESYALVPVMYMAAITTRPTMMPGTGD